ncbi:sugar porter family MFS transporter [Seonamhaeicola sp.]|uniref:sugar porter family MFS transporter n=1 Tax=Seonamhaeicola sp. TaxID=1912245 RepID=UPI00260FEA40|nr:sugar porter family MFS transporter [Seonamhaeicola sp.]
MNSLPKKIIFIASVVSIGGFLFGFDASVISGVIKFIKPEFNLTDLQLGWVVSSPSFSAMFAMLVSGRLSDYLGRKKVLLIVAVLYSLSALLSALASSYEILVLARMVGGAAFGAALILAPVYIAEVSPAESRGKLVTIQNLNIVIGFSAAYFCNYFFLQQIEASNFINEETAWRWMLGIELVPAVIYFFLLLLVPKSPRWLLLKNEETQARDILRRIYGDMRAFEEVVLIKESLKDNKEAKRVNLKSLFNPGLAFVLTLGFVIGILQQITGVNVVYFYATTIFEQSGIGSNAAFAQAIWVGIINIVFTVIAMYLIDRLGRRPLMLIGVAGVAVSMCISAYGFGKATFELDQDRISMLAPEIELYKLSNIIDNKYDNDVDFKNDLKLALGEQMYAKHEGDILKAAIHMNPILVLIGILGFVASFAISLGPVMWVLLAELFPNWIRGLAISVVAFVNSLVSWFVQFIFPYELAKIGSALTFFIFGILAVIGFLILLKIMPETKGKSLEEIENEFVKS